MATHFSAAVTSTAGLVGDVTGALTGVHYDAVAPVAYSGAAPASKAIDPAVTVASLTKASAGVDYTLAVPGAANINKSIFVYSATAYAHVVTVTGLLGGTTLTLTGAAIGLGFWLYAISATNWAVMYKNGATQTA
jgi:hypothetical protein